MNTRTRLLPALALGLLLGTPAGELRAQEEKPAPEPSAVDSLRARIEQLEARIDSLVARLAEARAAGEDEKAEAAEDELAALREAAERAAEAGAEDEEERAEAEAGSRTRNLQILNPEISITGDIVGNFTSPEGGPDNVSGTPREFEFSFQSALDPYTRTKIFITREEDFEIAGLAEEEEEGEGGGFEIEEGYLYWVGLPGGLGAKLGKFRQEIGLYNRWHTHALLDVERPLAAREFLGEDGLIQTGASLTLPSLTTGAGTQTLTLEATRGDNGVLFEGGNEISYLGRFQSFWDLSAASYLQLGATGVYGQNDDEDLESRVLALDASFRWTPPARALYQDLQLKAEWYFAEKQFPGLERTGDGGYLQASYRFDRRWILGARADYVDGFDEGPDVLGLAPNITWWQSEWVRLRLQYTYVKEEGGSANHTVLLQSVWAVGPHKHEHY